MPGPDPGLIDPGASGDSIVGGSTGGGNPFGGLNINDIINAALTIYGIRQGQSPPKFYTAPPTPGEEWKTGATQNLYNSYAGFANQFMGGLSNLNPNWQMPNDLTGNPQFMGGVRVPTIDMSKVPPITGGKPAPAPGTPTGGGGGPVSGGGDPFGNFTGNGNGNPNDPFAGMDPNQFDTNTRNGLSQIWNWMLQHPGITRGGADAVAAAVGAVGGPIAGIIASIGDKVFRNWFNTRLQAGPPTQPVVPPEQGGPQKNYVPNGPGGSIQTTPGATVDNPTRIHIDPITGLWSMDNPTPGEQAWLDSINSFNRGLMEGGPQGGWGSFGYGGGRTDTIGGYLGGGPFGSGPKF